MEPASPTRPRVVGRYVLHDAIAAGGMATVHLGRLVGHVGFERTVAIKRLHAHFAQDPEFVSMFLDEGRVVGRIRHPNVVPTLDVVAEGGELFIVMDYVQGESLARLIKAVGAQGGRIPPAFVASMLAGVLHGLHAAHEARSERGEPLGVVHRDISPQNILVGTDGVARVLDFGVAKAAGRIQTTREGQLKGKLAYMAPEQFSGVVGRATDVYAASVVLWEALTGTRLFPGDNGGHVMKLVLEGRIAAPSTLVPDLPPVLDAITLRGLSREPADRFATARDMALALEEALPLVAPSKIGAWVEATAEKTLHDRSERIAAIESSSSIEAAPAAAPGPPPRSDRPAARPDVAGVRATEEVPTQLSSSSSLPSPAERAGLGASLRSRRGLAVLAAGAIAAVVAIPLGLRGGTTTVAAAPVPAATDAARLAPVAIPTAPPRDPEPTAPATDAAPAATTATTAPAAPAPPRTAPPRPRQPPPRSAAAARAAVDDGTADRK